MKELKKSFVEKGKYLPKPIEEIEFKYLQKIDKAVFETFLFCEGG